ncbi:methionine synthase [Oxobacter pfennigii]|uniref:Methionine synthase n=1 Tax=Oxobacter pfennigii TaxID=36849 RepID=A0A0P8WD00_9CLOT|nr:cobalamin-dependent protein [Oxobacter pfennigii]KPU45641.1 methionine synthase [Oxobacter pfennigii]
MTKLSEALKDLNETAVYELVDSMLSEGVSPVQIVNECNEGLVAVGDLFAANEYYLTELMFSAEIMQGVMEKLEPLMVTEQSSAADAQIPTVVIGTVKGDIHDIGKNIVVGLLKSHGIKVVDLGVDVPAEKFVEAVRETGTKVLGLSALLNSTYPEMKNVVDAIAQAGLREQVKIIIGGTICNEAVREFTGADYWANEAVSGINICKKLLA